MDQVVQLAFHAVDHKIDDLSAMTFTWIIWIGRPPGLRMRLNVRDEAIDRYSHQKPIRAILDRACKSLVKLGFDLFGDCGHGQRHSGANGISSSITPPPPPACPPPAAPRVVY